jgi:hypothetical protein
MKKFIANNWFKIALIILSIWAFYWFELRPSVIKQKCANEFIAVSVQDYQKDFYEMCLHENGL